jgi:hypothetical protein
MLVMKPVVFITVMMAIFDAGASAQSSRACDCVVKEVSLENTIGITAERQASLRTLLIGRCFQWEHGEVLSEPVYNQLRSWGYRRPTVYDPNILVLHDDVHPSPVAVTVDFRIGDLDQSTK